jgi:hypothetical protein
MEIKRRGRPPKIKEIVMEEVKEPEKVEVIIKSEQKYVPITIDLGETSDHITINGLEFWHGHTYNVIPELVGVLNDVMYSTKVHDANYQFGKNQHKLISPRRLS